jgi:uncharacterized protein
LNKKTGKPEELPRDHSGFNKNAEPFFSIIMEGLKGEVDGEHFWDAVAENAEFEFQYNFPGFPNKIKGRKSYMDWFGGYSSVLDSADHLHVYKSAQPPQVFILEYEVHGKVSSTRKAYQKRLCSIITIENRKIVHWRDYMDSLAVMLPLE